MTAPDTPSREELLALATDLSNDKPGSRTRAAEVLRRLAAKPADDGVREAKAICNAHVKAIVDRTLSPKAKP